MAVALLVVILAAPAGAVDELRLDIGDMAGKGWSATGIALSWQLAPGDTAPVVVTADRVDLPAPLGTLTGVRLACARFVQSGPNPGCEGGRLRARSAAFGAISAPAAVRQAGRGVDFAVGPFDALGGRLSARGRASRSGWAADVDAAGVDLAAALPALASLFTLPGGLEPTGIAGGSLRIVADRGNRPVVTGNLTLTGVDASGFDDRLATGTLSAAVDFTVSRVADGLAFDADTRITAGELYAEPVYLDATAVPIEFAMSGTWQPDTGRLTADTLRLYRSQSVALSGTLDLDTRPKLAPRSADIDITRATMPGAYDDFLRPYLIGTPLDSLDSQGHIAGTVTVRDGAPAAVDLVATALDFDDRRERFSLQGIDAEVHWRRAQAPASRFAWTGGAVYGIELGAASAEATLAGRGFAIDAPIRLPVLDGHLDVRELALDDTGAEGARVRFDAELEPVGLTALTEAVGWPSFGGTLSGSLPSLTYEDNVVTLGGSLQARVFDGDVAVDRLRIEDPLGVLPVLTADVTLRQLDLEPLTAAFEFGRMEGRLHGDIVDLRLLGWKPVQFDARFYTPPGDRSRRRISQRAIESISNIGGFGAAAALSGIAVSLFKDFAYDRIDIRCRLRDEVCLMGGLAAAEGGGYYLVKGRGLPRIDVIGYSSEVNWPTLVDRLSNTVQPTTSPPDE